MQAISMQPDERRIIILDEISGQDEIFYVDLDQSKEDQQKFYPMRTVADSRVVPPEQSIWSHHLLRGPRRQGSGDQLHNPL
jgi:hypothetical protein